MTLENQHNLISAKIDEPKSQEGQEKKVIRVTRNGIALALKVYLKKHYDTQKAINRTFEATSEFNLYQIAAADQVLSPYIPEPFDLEYEEGQPVGLLVEWKEGEPLAYNLDMQIPRQALLDLKQALLSAPPELWLLDDCFMDYNICWDGQRIWLAELKLGSYSSEQHWKQTVQGRINQVINNYCG